MILFSCALELNKKENEVNLIINNYQQLLGSRFYQMNVTSKDNNSKYSYFFNTIDNINSIKFISYSIPQAKYNININNNRFKYTITPGSDIYFVYNHNWVDDAGKYKTTYMMGASKITYTHRF